MIYGVSGADRMPYKDLKPSTGAPDRPYTKSVISLIKSVAYTESYIPTY